jgi:acyl-CoA synthetase (NDP forming)
MHDLDLLFNPSSVAVIGASSDRNKLSGRTIHFLKTYGFKGKIFPVNPSSPEVQGLQAFPSVSAIPDPVDQAIIIVPSQHVEAAVRDCAKKGVKILLVLSSGFGEMGPEGRVAQDRLLAIAREAGMRMIGPNSLGALSPANGVFCTFSSSFARGVAPAAGQVAFVTQSGAFGSCAYVMADLRGVGMSRTLATGNEADVDVALCIDYLAEDPSTKVICASLESCKNGELLRQAIRKASQAGKAVVIMKVGASEVGSVAAATHTGSLAGDDRVYDTIFSEAGAWRARSIEEMIDIAYLIATSGVSINDRVSLVTVSGGIGVLLADDAARFGLDLVPFSQPLLTELAEILPYGTGRNPYDTTAQVATNHAATVQVGDCILRHTAGDALLLYLANNALAPEVFKNTQAALIELKTKNPARMIMVIMPSETGVRRALEQVGIPVFEDPTRAIAALAAMREIGRRGESLRQVLPLSPTRELSAPVASEAQAKSFLQQHGVSITREEVCASVERAVAVASSMGYPVVAKIASPDIAHKTEIGGVILNIQTESALRDAFALLLQRAQAAYPKAQIDGVLVATMLTRGVETLIGVNRDPVFGPMVMFGMGGVMVELYKDVAMASAPLDRASAAKLVASVKGSVLLDGFRGGPHYDREALIDALCRISELAVQYPQITSMDVNPVLVMESGAVALDAVIATS